MKTILIFSKQDITKFQNDTFFLLSKSLSSSSLHDFHRSDSPSETQLILDSKMISDLKINDLKEGIGNLESKILSRQKNIEEKTKEIAELQQEIENLLEIKKIAKKSKTYLGFFKTIIKRNIAIKS